MLSKDFDFSIYERLLRLGEDWAVSEVMLDESNDTLNITIFYKHDYWVDKETGEMIPIHDFRKSRSWRHLDCMEFKTVIHCRLPRIKTAEGKVRTIAYDWAESDFSHTKKFENKCIEVLQATHNRKSTSELMRVSDDKICGIMHSAVERGLKRRDLSNVRKISLDEKSYKKGHQYLTVLTNSITGAVLDVEQDRTEASAERLLTRTFTEEQLSNITTTCCDMWDAFTNALKKKCPNARLVFDKFHVVKHLTQAIDKTRREEVKSEEILKKTRYMFLKRLDTMTDKQRKRFETENIKNTQTAGAWRMRENFLALYDCENQEEASTYFECWYKSVIHSSNEYMKKAAKTIKEHIGNIITQIGVEISNARAEQTNSKIAKIQRAAQGFRSYSNLRTAILFFNGSLRLFHTINE